MKLTQKQLRHLVNETVKHKLTEGFGETSQKEYYSDDVGMGASYAITNELIDYLSTDAGASNAFEMWKGIEDPEDMTLPSRIEDIPAFATKLADKTLQDEDLREALIEALGWMLKSAMNAR